ncbi:MAG: hypothetical protein HY646_13650, partial [Acidobacteria bacterium]|nr:hypothetical protein [Acidobacteriota bacterium]
MWEGFRGAVIRDTDPIREAEKILKENLVIFPLTPNDVGMRQSWTHTLFYLGIWTLLALFFSSRLILSYAYAGQLTDWQIPVLLSLIEWYGWAALTPVLMLLAKKFPIHWRNWRSAVLVHLPSSILLSVLKI